MPGTWSQNFCRAVYTAPYVLRRCSSALRAEMWLGAPALEQCLASERDGDTLLKSSGTPTRRIKRNSALVCCLALTITPAAHAQDQPGTPAAEDVMTYSLPLSLACIQVLSFPPTLL